MGNTSAKGFVVAAGTIIAAPVWACILSYNELRDALAKRPKQQAPASLQKAHEEFSGQQSVFGSRHWDFFLDTQVKSVLRCYDPTFYNMAFIGSVNAGKSSLINALRGIKDAHIDEKDAERAAAGRPLWGAAKVSATEETMVPNCYATATDAAHQYFGRIWDLPGAGTSAHPAATYYNDKRLYAFDCIVLLIDQTVREVDVLVLQEAARLGQPVALVHTKSDMALRNLMEDHDMDAEEAAERLRNDVKASVRCSLAAKGLEHMYAEPFFVSKRGFCNTGGKASGYPEGLPRGVMDEPQLLVWLHQVVVARH